LELYISKDNYKGKNMSQYLFFFKQKSFEFVDVWFFGCADGWISGSVYQWWWVYSKINSKI